MYNSTVKFKQSSFRHNTSDYSSLWSILVSEILNKHDFMSLALELQSCTPHEKMGSKHEEVSWAPIFCSPWFGKVQRFCLSSIIFGIDHMDLWENYCNRPFHVRLKYLLSAVIARDVISGVHSCTILGYFCTAVNGKCGLLHTVTSTPYCILQYSEGMQNVQSL